MAQTGSGGLARMIAIYNLLMYIAVQTEER